MASAGNSDAYIQKLDSNGNFQWAKRIGGALGDAGRSVSTDLSGNIYVVGTFLNTIDCDPGIDTFNLTSSGGTDVFILKLDSSGNFIWANQIGGVGYQFSNSISNDLMNNVYISGSFEGTIDFDPDTNSTNLTSNGGNDIFIQKLDSNGSLIWVRQMGGSYNDVAQATVIGANGGVYTIGVFNDTIDLNPGSGVYNLISLGNTDVFVQKLDASGSFQWAKQSGSGTNETGLSIATDFNNNVYQLGGFEDTINCNLGLQSVSLVSNGFLDIFIQKLSQSIPVNLDESIVSKNFVLFPNPTEGNFSIKFENPQESIHIRLFSISGQELMNKSFQHSSRMELEIKQAPGLYFLELTDEKGNREVMKVLKK